MVTISSARRNKIKDSIIKEQLMQSIINDLKINIEENTKQTKMLGVTIDQIKAARADIIFRQVSSRR